MRRGIVTHATTLSDRARGAAIFFIALGMFGLYVIEFGLVGILPSIISRYDISIIEAGWLVGSFALIIAVLGPFIVLLLARYDRRKMLVGSLLVFAACSAVSAFAPTYPSLLAIRAPAALLQAVFFSVAFTTARSLYAPNKATHAISLVFVGTSIGLVFGVPITAFVEALLSYEAAFFFSALANLVAAAGIWCVLPRESGKKVASTESVRPFAVILQPAVYLALLQVICVFGAMFSLYSFAAEYLRSEARVDGQTISALLLVFGVGGVLGNLFFGRMLGRNLVRTVLVYPITLALSYAVLMLFNSSGLVILATVCFIWGLTHTAGMVVGQVWTTTATSDQPEFVTSLFVSAGNFGVMAGSSAGGLLITRYGMSGAIWSGWMFAAASILLVLAALRYRTSPAVTAPQIAH